MSDTNTAQDVFGDAISTYSRAQAIEDGELADVSRLAREAGFRFPVAVTRRVWDNWVSVPAGVACQDETGRLWDVLSVLRFAIRASGGDIVHFKVLFRMRGGMRTAKLWAQCGPGDDAEPVITVMEEGED